MGCDDPVIWMDTVHLTTLSKWIVKTLPATGESFSFLY
jgi:hypothetical protein